MNKKFCWHPGLVLGLGLIFFMNTSASSHPDGDQMSDSAAETEFRIVLELNPKDTATWNRLGIVLYRQDKVKEAADAFGRVLEMKPGDFDAHDGMGLVNIKEGKFREAVTWFRKAIAIAPEDTMVYYHLGYAFEMMGSLKEAEGAYVKALEINAAILRKSNDRELETDRRSILNQAVTELRRRMKESAARQKTEKH